MSKESAENIKRILVVIADDMKADADYFDGKPLTGKLVGVYFGNQGAAIAAIASILNELVKELEVEEAAEVEA